MSAKKPTAILYARVSSEEQKKKQTIDSQLPEVERLAAANNVEVVEVRDPVTGSMSRVVTDNGRSGRFVTSRWLGAVLKDVEAGRLQVDHIVCVKFDRLWRRAKKDKRSRDECNWAEGVLIDAGITLITSEGLMDPGEALISGIRQGIASAENDIRSENVDRGRRRLLAAGKPIWGKTPYGYRREYLDISNPKHGFRIVPDPVRAKHARQILEWYCEGGLGHAARQAMAAKMPRPGDPLGTCGSWAGSTVAQIIKQVDRWRGTVSYDYRGQHGDIAVEPIITAEQYLRVQRARQERAICKDRSVFLTTGTVVCSRCHRGLQVVHPSWPDRRYQYLRCFDCHKQIKYRDFADALYQAAVWRSMVIASQAQQMSENGGFKAKLASLSAEMTEVTRQIDVQINLHVVEGILTKDDLARRLDPLREKERTLRARIDVVKSQEKRARTQREQKNDLIRRAFDVCDRMRQASSEEERNRLLREMLGGERIIVDPFTWMMTFPAVGNLGPAQMFRVPTILEKDFVFDGVETTLTPEEQAVEDELRNRANIHRRVRLKNGLIAYEMDFVLEPTREEREARIRQANEGSSET